MTAIEKVKAASEKDDAIYCERGKEGETWGHNPNYLLEVHGITKNDLIRLERKGLALKARYEMRHPKAGLWDKLDAKIAEHNAALAEGGNPLLPVSRKCGTHRVRWILFKGVA